MSKFAKVIMIVSMLIFVCTAVCFAEEDIKTLEKKLASDPNNVTLLKQVGLYYHEIASKGDKAAVKKALTNFEKATKLAKDDYAIKAWYGSTLCLVGRDTKNPLTQYKKVKDGLALMDEAVKKYPDSYEIRMCRAMTTVNLPESIFKRLRQSVDDFMYLINKDKEKPGFLPEREKRLAYLNMGYAFKTGGAIENAIKCWKRVVEINADSPEGKEAAGLLKKYGF